MQAQARHKAGGASSLSLGFNNSTISSIEAGKISAIVAVEFLAAHPPGIARREAGLVFGSGCRRRELCSTVSSRAFARMHIEIVVKQDEPHFFWAVSHGFESSYSEIHRK